MKRIAIIFAIFCACVNLSAQESVAAFSIPEETPGTHRVYAELLGYGTNVLGLNKNVTVSVDLGQFQSAFKAYTLLDENGKTIKFNSMVAAMNYMGERNWKFVQAYIVTETNKQNVYHWLMYKDITTPEEIFDGIRVSNTDSQPQKPEKEKKKNKKPMVDDIYGK